MNALELNDGRIKLWHGDCIDVMRGFPFESVDAIVTDPPYGIFFMSRDWDHGVPGERFWRKMLTVAKPGAHLLAFGGTRTHHRLMCAIEDAGWEIRDCLMYLYGSGFPKSLDVSKAIDERLGADREVVGKRTDGRYKYGFSEDAKRAAGSEWKENQGFTGEMGQITAPATEQAKQWEGWGSNLKPAYEPIILARKPLEGTVAQNVLEHGTGGLNIDGCRVGVSEEDDIHAKNPHTKGGFGHAGESIYGDSDGADAYNPTQGRWPANIIHDGSEEVVGMFPETAMQKRSMRGERTGEIYGGGKGLGGPDSMRGHDDTDSSAARFFYSAKSSKIERGPGNNHPTVKPISLCEYLVKLIAPKGAVVLDPFMGSGSTGIACHRQGCIFWGIEKENSGDTKYLDIAVSRLEAELQKAS